MHVVNLKEFAQAVVKAAHETGTIKIVPMNVKDLSRKCILRFRFGGAG